MSPTRREFMQRFGIAVASALLAGCKIVVQPTPPPRARLRALWLELGGLAALARDDMDRSERKRDALAADHRAVLDELVAAGELREPVAAQVQAAYDAAAFHTWRANVPITCYESVLIDFRPASSADLVTQADIVAGAGDLAPETVAQVQTAIERDLAFLALTQPEEEALYERVLGDWKGDSPIPRFGDVTLDVPPDAAEAARFLLRVLLGT